MTIAVFCHPYQAGGRPQATSPSAVLMPCSVTRIARDGTAANDCRCRPDAPRNGPILLSHPNIAEMPSFARDSSHSVIFATYSADFPVQPARNRARTYPCRCPAEGRDVPSGVRFGPVSSAAHRRNPRHTAGVRIWVGRRKHCTCPCARSSACNKQSIISLRYFFAGSFFPLLMKL